MSVPTLGIREYRSLDEPAVLALLHRALGGGRAFDRTDRFWRWKHQDNVFGPSLMLVAEDGGILGLRAFMRWEFAGEGRGIRAVRAVDTATHPEHRRRGVFSDLTRAAVRRARQEGVDLIFNTPNRQSLPGYLKLGWTYVGRPSLLIRVRRPLRMVRTLLRHASRSMPTTVGDTRLPLVEDLLSRSDVVERLVQENDRLCAGRFRTQHSPIFLRWRYATVPSVPYYAVWSGSDPAAALIVRPNIRRGLRELMVSELLLTSGGDRHVGRLIGTAVAASDADYAVAHAPRRSVHRQVLVRAGFVPLPYLGPHFTVHVLGDAAAGARQLSSWHLSLGDLEMF